MIIYCEECDAQIMVVDSPSSWPAAILRRLPRLCKDCQEDAERGKSRV